MSALCAWCIDILYLRNVSTFALVQPACVTICLFVYVPETPEIPRIHRSPHAGSISFLVVTAKAEWFLLKPHCSLTAELCHMYRDFLFFLIYILPYGLFISTQLQESFVKVFNLLQWNWKEANTNNMKVCKWCTHNYSTPIRRSCALLQLFFSDVQYDNKQKIILIEKEQSLLFLIFF